MDARAGMRRGGREIQAAHRRAVSEVWKCRPPKELLRKLRAAATQISPNQVFVHRLEVFRRKNRPRGDEAAKARRQTLDAFLDFVREGFLVDRPALFHFGRNARICPQRVAPGRSTAWVDQRLLADHEEWIARHTAGTHFVCKAG